MPVIWRLYSTLKGWAQKLGQPTAQIFLFQAHLIIAYRKSERDGTEEWKTRSCTQGDKNQIAINLFTLYQLPRIKKGMDKTCCD